ncbi:hypothetical protein QTP86_026941, partial [Hemibagrus guttatus]
IQRERSPLEEGEEEGEGEGEGEGEAPTARVDRKVPERVSRSPTSSTPCSRARARSDEWKRKRQSRQSARESILSERVESCESDQEVNQRINGTETLGNETSHSVTSAAKPKTSTPPTVKPILPVQTGVKAQEEEQSSGMSIFFSLLVIGICIILVHLLIRFKLHFLPESVAVVSLGKGRELADMMERRKVDILCVQETRWKGSKARSIGAGFKLFYYGVDSKRNGVGVVLKEEFVRNVLEVKRVSDRVMSLKLEIEGVMLNVVSGYAPQVGCEIEEKERFWSELDEVMESIPTGERVVIGADFNGHLGEGNRGDEEVMGKFGVKERNLEGQMVVDFAKRMDMGVVNTYFQKREEHRVTYKSGGRRTQVDYILCRRGNLKEISDCKVVVGESVARQHRMVVCRMTLMVCKKKRPEIEIEKKTKWWKLKKEECCEEFRQKLRQALGGQVVLPDDWESTAEVIRETGRKVLGVSSGRRKEDKETWWWNEEVQDSIQRKRLAKKKWDMDRTEENRQEYKELQHRVKREVSKAKQKAYDELYTRLDTREGEKDLYRLARQRDRDGKDVQQVRVIKDRAGRVLTSEESVQRRWKEYFEELMNEENEREKRVEGVNSVEQEVDKIRKDEVRKALKKMKSGKAVGPDDIPVEVWKCLGEAAVEFLTSLFNRVLERILMGAVIKIIETQELANWKEEEMFRPNMFFPLLLPPIIFESRGNFFQNIGSITLFAVIGTAISAFIVGGGIYFLGQADVIYKMTMTDSFAFGSLISAVDPVATIAIFNALNVDPVLNMLGFGESILNDAVSIVLTNTAEGFTGPDAASVTGWQTFLQALGYFLKMFFGSAALGTLTGLISALVSSCTLVYNGHPVLRYVMSHYTHHNLSPVTQILMQQTLRTVAFMCETCVFAFPGLSIFSFPHKFEFSFVIWGIVLVLLGRAVNIFPLSFLLNFFRDHKITPKMMFIMWFSGLRGAIPYALSLHLGLEPIEKRQLIGTTTIVIVLFTILLMGGGDHASHPHHGHRGQPITAQEQKGHQPEQDREDAILCSSRSRYISLIFTSDFIQSSVDFSVQIHPASFVLAFRFARTVMCPSSIALTSSRDTNLQLTRLELWIFNGIKSAALGNTVESEHLSELTEEEYESQIVQRQDLKGFLWLDAKYLNPFFTRRLTQEDLLHGRIQMKTLTNKWYEEVRQGPSGSEDEDDEAELL